MSFSEEWKYNRDAVIGHLIMWAVLTGVTIIGVGYLLHVGWSLYG